MMKATAMNTSESAIALEERTSRYARNPVAIATAVAVAFAVLCIAGVLLRYSPVPMTDDWDVYVGFNLDVLEGKTSAWWALYDAHRLIFPRLLIWLDFHYFGARQIFLVVANMALRVGILAAFLVYVRNQLKGTAFTLFAALACILAFAWMQAPLFYKGIDGIISFLAIIFPLLGFYWLHLTKENAVWFFPALLAGLASLGTLANGLVVLPIMVLMSAIIGLGARRTAILAVVCCASTALYFSDFSYPDHPRPGMISFVLFIFTYLGSPFYYAAAYWLAGLQHLAGFIFSHGSFLVGGTFQDYPASQKVGTIVALLTGAFLVVATLVATWRWWRLRRTNPCQAALLAFIGFIIAGAALTALGRAEKGFDYAVVQERYTAGTLLAWQALGLIAVASLPTAKAIRVLTITIVVVSAALLPNQLRAVLKPDVQDRLSAQRSLEALRTGQSDDELIARQVRRLKEMGIVLGQ